MPRQRSEYTIAKCNDAMEPINKENWKTVKGDFYIRVLLHDKSETHVKHRNAVKKWLPEDGDPTKPPVKLTHYIKSPRGRNREPHVYEPLILEDVQKFKENLGYLATIAVDETQTLVKKPKTIGDLWELYRVQDLERRVSLKNFEDKLETSTIDSHQNSFNRYKELFNDHEINDFPRNLRNKFRELAPRLPKLNNPDETLSPITVRTIGGHLNRFFDWCSNEDQIPGRPMKLLLPSKKLKKVKTKIPTLADRNQVEAKLKSAVKEWESKEYRKHNRTTEAGRFKTLLRVFMMGNFGSLRRGEVWSLPLDRIDLDQRRIYVRPVNEEGGLSKANKPIFVKFNPKSQGEDFQPIPKKLYDFLVEDLANRGEDEKWFLDKGDGSVWYASPDGITKAIKKVLDELGIEGGSMHWFRKARLNEIWEKNPNASKHFGRHQEIETTESHYVSGEKPKDLIDLVDSIDQANGLIN